MRAIDSPTLSRHGLCHCPRIGSGQLPRRSFSPPGHHFSTTFQLVTTSWILDEVATFFNNRSFHEKAVEVGRRLQTSVSVDLFHVEESLFRQGWHLFETHHDKRYSLTDCVSFAVMQALGLSEALAFDHHFEQAGFVRLPADDGPTA